MPKTKAKKNQYCLTNARVVLPDKIISRGSVVVKGKKIVAIRVGSRLPRGVAKINARGNFVGPGFIDLHIHGDIREVSRQQTKGGTTGFLATLHPAKPKALLKNIAQALSESSKVSGAGVLGLRLEGPFLNRAFCGALPLQALRQPDLQEAKKIVAHSAGALKMVVLAPELKAAPRLIRLLKKHQIIVSLGHTAATYEQAIKGIEAGISHATHTFNRMRQFNQRDPGATGAALTDNRLACEVIPDGIHVHRAALKLLIKCKGLDKVILITDSTVALNHPSKKRQGDIFRLKDGTLYGTALTLNKAVKNAIKFLGISLPEAIRLVTLNPAKVLKIDKNKGSLAVGKDADLVIFDRDFSLKMTMVEGKIVYKCVG